MIPQTSHNFPSLLYLTTLIFLRLKTSTSETVTCTTTSTNSCEIECGTLSCGGDSLECLSDRDCSISCNGWWSCYGSDLYCPENGSTCNINCNGYSSCQADTINNLTIATKMIGDTYINCGGENSCKDTNIYCSMYGNCTLICDDEDACENINLYCSNNPNYLCTKACRDNEADCDSVNIIYYEDILTSPTSPPETTQIMETTQHSSTAMSTIISTISTTDIIITDLTTTKKSKSITTSQINQHILTTDSLNLDTSKTDIVISTNIESNDESNDNINGSKESSESKEEIISIKQTTLDPSTELSKKNNKNEDKTGLIAALIVVSIALAAALCIMSICCMQGISPCHHKRNSDKTVISAGSNLNDAERVASIEPIGSDYPEDLEPGSPRMMSLENSVQNNQTTDIENSLGNNIDGDGDGDGNPYGTGYMQNGHLQVMDNTDQEDDIIDNNNHRRYKPPHGYKYNYNNNNYGQGSSNGNNSPTSSVEGRRSRLHSALNESVGSSTSNNHSKQSIGSIIYPTPGGQRPVFKGLPRPPARNGANGDPNNVNDSINNNNNNYNYKIPGARRKRRARARTEPMLNDANNNINNINNDINELPIRRRSRLQGEASPQSSLNIEAIVEGDINDDIDVQNNINNNDNDNINNIDNNDDNYYVTPGAPPMPEAPGMATDHDEKEEKEIEEQQESKGNKKGKYATRRGTVNVMPVPENYSIDSDNTVNVGKYNIV